MIDQFTVEIIVRHRGFERRIVANERQCERYEIGTDEEGGVIAGKFRFRGATDIMRQFDPTVG